MAARAHPVMNTDPTNPVPWLPRPARLSFAVMLVMLVLVGWLHMTTLLLTILFASLALRRLSFGRSKLLGIVLFLLLMATVTWGMWTFGIQAYKSFPRIAEATIPAVVSYAESRGLELPFTDWQSLRALAMTEVEDQYARIGGYARTAAFQMVYLIIGLFVSVSLFINSKFRIEGDPHTADDNMYTLTAQEIGIRFRTFYRSFSTVMGAQILISTVNTALTAAFLFAAGFNHAVVLTFVTFLFGLLPIVGNIASNTIITAVGFTISPKMALMALLFLITIHKLEYFLNSHIIGNRIKNPMWLTLLGLLVGEKLMGIPGMILAPVILHYVKVESSRAKIRAEELVSANARDAEDARTAE
ncbi:MAG: AI-2E family transporter [Verrucomicrobiae bacterium]|nr:AI-2E family transporter [Verrucomicrobiae bacterium]